MKSRTLRYGPSRPSKLSVVRAQHECRQAVSYSGRKIDFPVAGRRLPYIVRRLFHLGLMLLAVIGLAGQSTAHATTSAKMSAPSQMASGPMSCSDEMGRQDRGKAPCKKVGWQCLAAIGCPAMTMAKPVASAEGPAAIDPLKSVPGVADVLHGRSYAPELEPPSTSI